MTTPTSYATPPVHMTQGPLISRPTPLFAHLSTLPASLHFPCITAAPAAQRDGTDPRFGGPRAGHQCCPTGHAKQLVYRGGDV